MKIIYDKIYVMQQILYLLKGTDAKEWEEKLYDGYGHAERNPEGI